MILEPIENYPKDRNIEYFKMDCSEEDLQEMISKLPKGYDFVMQGIVRENDIFYSFGEWDLINIVDNKTFTKVIGHGVNNFHGVARPIK